MPSEPRMLFLQGISGSGKSTYAQKLKSESPNDVEIISRDGVREELLGAQLIDQYFQQGMNVSIEDEVSKILRLRTAVALKVGKRVVIDNTNLRARYVSEYIKIAIDMGLSKEEIKIKRFDVDVEAATERVKQRKKFPVPKEVIQQQHDALVNAKFTVDELWEKITAKYIPRRWYLPPFEVNPRINDNSLPKAVICDLDGTLAHRRLITSGFIQYRSFFDYAKCGTDIADLLVTDVVKGLRNQGYTIIFVSGRKSSCIDITKDFIQRATGFKENEYLLFMRNELQDTHHNTNTGRIEDDSDDIVKYRLYNEYIRGKYNVVGAIDDRKRVVALWEQLGLRVLNVGLLNEEF